MSRIKLHKDQIQRMLSSLVIAEDNLEDAFALAVWSLITEPGDSVARALIETLGPAAALGCELDRVDARRYKALIEAATLDSESAERLKNLETILVEARQRWQPRLRLSAVEEMLGVARQVKAKLVTPQNPNWPQQLSDLKLGQPHCLWVRGEVHKLAVTHRSLAVVGSRMATPYGEWATTEIVSAAAESNLAIISGGAYGIDAIAHRSSLAVDTPTIAIMAGGVDRLYPSGNSDLLAQIIRTTAVISEQAPGGNPTKWRFLQRNRLIAALSNATVVVEAGKRSGAINTTHHADLLARPIGVVPGQLNSPASIGCINLIKEDPDRLITSAQDAVALVTGEWEPELFDDDPMGPLETRALDAMGRKALPESEIGMRAGLTARELITALGRLQLLGLVAQGHRGWSKLT